MMAAVFLYFVFKPHNPSKKTGIPGILSSLQPILAKNVAEIVTQKYINADVLETKLTDPLLLQALRPEMENHVDQFIAVKLPEIFPLLAKMMGEKTLSKFKEAFLAEAETIFPALIKNYGNKLLFKENVQQQIEEKLNLISIPALKKIFYKHASLQITKFKTIGLLCGLFIGTLQIVLLLLFS